MEGSSRVEFFSFRNEFKTLDWQTIYDSMKKPAFVFDGRLILDQPALEKIGFQVRTIGRGSGF